MCRYTTDALWNVSKKMNTNTTQRRASMLPTKKAKHIIQQIKTHTHTYIYIYICIYIDKQHQKQNEKQNIKQPKKTVNTQK